MNEKISIIIPVYNVEKYLNRCVDSVLNQTYKNIEIILVNDGSTDNSKVLCDKYSKIDSRIKVIHKENGGLSDARNEGLKIATGEYIAFLDSDDWIDFDYYEVMYNKMKSFNSDISVIGFLWVNGESFNKPPFYTEDKLLSAKEAIEELIKDKLLTSHAWNKLFKKHLFDGIEFPKGRTYEDVFIMHKIFERANKILLISDFKHYYFMRNSSIIHSASTKNRLDEILAFKSRYFDLKDDFPYLEEIMLEHIYARIIKLYYIDPLSFSDKKKYRNEIKELNKFIRDNNSFSLIGVKGRILNKNLILFKMLFKAKEKLPKNSKKIIKSIINKKEKLNSLDSNKNKVILCGSPEYGNIGDLAIAYFTKKFMEKNSEYEFIEISEKQFHNNMKYMIKNIKKDDILLLQGGGNLGSQYIDQEEIRSKVISMFPNNRIILMPQTIYFSNDKYGQNLKKQISKKYSSHKKLKIFARETISFNIMNDIFKNNVYLVPDIVMSSNISFKQKKRNGVMLCLRSDVEGILKINDLIKIKNIVREKFDNYYFSDTVYDETITLDKREQVLFELWDKMQRSNLVITDRLHGMIFAAITGTPCIVIGNYNHKVKACYNWFKNLEYIKFCNSIDEVEKVINMLDYEKQYQYPCEEFSIKFKDLKDLIDLE